MITGPVVVTVWQGTLAVKAGKKLVDETDPIESRSWIIRGDFSIENGKNNIHTSDSVEYAEKKIKLWFSEEEDLRWP